MMLPDTVSQMTAVSTIPTSISTVTSSNGNATTSPADIITRQTKDYYANLTAANQKDQSLLGGGVVPGLTQGVLGALPPGFKTDVRQIADFQLGTFLGRHGVVNGSTATLINGVIDFIKSGKSTKIDDKVINNANFNIGSKFIPVVIQTEFNLGNNGKSPLYIVFQSTPDNIVFTKGASWNPKEFFGRPEPIQIYASSGAISFSLTGRFFADSSASMSQNLDLEKQLFALVTPSKNHFMPSPVILSIGQWKQLRCITTNVSIDFQGPWYIPAALTSTRGGGYAPTLPSHSPYVYDVTFNFTITSQENSVQYAEDIVDYGFNGGIAQTNSSALQYNNTTNTASKSGPTVYSSNVTANYDPDTGEIIYSIAGTAGGIGTTINQVGAFSTTAYLQNLGLPTDANNSMKQSALGEITSGLGAITQTALVKNYGPQITKVLGR